MNEKLTNMMNMARESKSSNSAIIDLLSSFDIVYASEEEEFFYKDTDEPVPEGEPIGIDLERGNEVRLVLFKNIYWKVDLDV